MLFMFLQHSKAVGSSSSAWAKGTGYRGAGSYYSSHGHHGMKAEEQKSRKAAAHRQQGVDNFLQLLLCLVLCETCCSCYCSTAALVVAAAAVRGPRAQDMEVLALTMAVMAITA